MRDKCFSFRNREKNTDRANVAKRSIKDFAGEGWYVVPFVLFFQVFCMLAVPPNKNMEEK